MKKNILVFNWKGGAAKTTISSIIASYIQNSTLIEIDKINQSDAKIDSKEYYKSIQIDFINETSESFYEFENLLLEEGVHIVDVGSIKLETFFKAMKANDLLDQIDLIVIPAMDGADDFRVAVKFLNNLKNLVDSSKIIFAFNRFDPFEFEDNPKEQFNSFFENKSILKNDFGIDLDDENNYFVIKNSKAIKKARAKGITIRSLIDQDINEITKKQRKETNQEKRFALTKERGLIINAQNLYKNYIQQMMNKIVKKLEAQG